MRSKFVLPVILALVAAHAARAQDVKDVKDPATLMPEKPLAYAEVRHVGALAKEIGALLQGSVLGNPPDSLSKIRSKYQEKLGGPGREAGMVAGIFGLMFAPEIVAELSRVQGAAIALTGIDVKKGEPEFIAVVLPGQSNAPTFFMRMMLTMAPMRKLETVEGVTLYGIEMHSQVMKPMKPGDKFPEWETRVTLGPTCAMAPGALFIGSHDHVKDGVLRLKGMLRNPSLAQSATFQEARRKTEDKPGLFAFGDPAHLVGLFDKLPLSRSEKAMLSAVIKAVNPAAIRGVAKTISLEQGRLSVRKLVLLDPNEKSQVLDLLPTRPLDPGLFHFAPKDAVLAAAIDNGGGEKRLQDFVALVDEFAPPGQKFGDHIMEMEKALGFSFGKDVMAQIASIGFAMGDPLKVKIKVTERITDDSHSISSRAETPTMVFIVQAVNEKAAQDLMGLVPKLRIPGGPPIAPVKITVNGRDLFVLKLNDKAEGDDAAFCYGREGSTVVIGPYAFEVAKCLIAGARKDGLLASPQIADRVKELKDRQALVFMKPAHLTIGFGSVWVGSEYSSKTTTSRAPDPFEKDKRPEKPAKKPEVKVTYHSPLDDPDIKRLSEILRQEEYLALGLLHSKDRLQIDGDVGGLRPLVSQLIDAGVEAAYRQEALRIQRWEEMRKKERERFEK